MSEHENQAHRINLKKESDDYGPYVKMVRTEIMDMTQEQFADVMGVSVGTLRNWEQGTSPVPKYFVRAMAVMQRDPGGALSALNVGIGISGSANDRWDSPDVRQSSAAAHTRAMAIERIKERPGFAKAMDVIDQLRDFSALVQDLGMYPALSHTDLLLLYQTVELGMMREDIAAILARGNG